MNNFQGVDKKNRVIISALISLTLLITFFQLKISGIGIQSLSNYPDRTSGQDPTTIHDSNVIIRGTICRINFENDYTILYLKTEDNKKIPVKLEKQLTNNNSEFKVGMKVEIQARFVDAPQGQQNLNGEII